MWFRLNLISEICEIYKIEPPRTKQKKSKIEPLRTSQKKEINKNSKQQTKKSKYINRIL